MVTIIDDDGPDIMVQNVNVVEGDEGLKNVIFTVQLGRLSPQIVSVNFVTANGTAEAGSDYVATSGTVVVPAGDTQTTVSIPVIGDTVDEPNENFQALSCSTHSMASFRPITNPSP